MKKYISILRGINVSGQKQIKMDDLKKVYEGLGFSDVSTYIQSGNILFNSLFTETTRELEASIAASVRETFGFEVPVIVRTVNEMGKVIADNPFLNITGLDRAFFHVTFLAEVPAATYTEKIRQFACPPDKFLISDREVYLYCPGGYGKTKLNNTFFENRLKVSATTRNWNTVVKLLDLAKGLT